jgi:hypothetical protein
LRQFWAWNHQRTLGVEYTIGMTLSKLPCTICTIVRDQNQLKDFCENYVTTTHSHQEGAFVDFLHSRVITSFTSLYKCFYWCMVPIEYYNKCFTK